MNVKFSKTAKIGILLGGLSKEREVSLRTGKALADGLRRRGYANVVEIDVDAKIAVRLERDPIDAAVIALHGNFGEDGTIQGILEYARIPYAGAGVTASAVAMDKILSKRLFRMAGVPTPPWHRSPRDESLESLRAVLDRDLGYPCIAKPNQEGSTLGFSKVHDASGVAAAQALALQHGETVLWEKFIDGMECTVGILGDRVLPIVEIVPLSGFYDYAAKYTKGKTEYFCPARVPDAAARVMQDAARKAFDALGTEQLGRVDILYKDGTPWVLEVNTIPGMTETSLLPKAAAAAGIAFDEMAEIILQGARLRCG